MSKKGFLYSGATFLIMVSILLSMSYLFLQKHNKEESRVSVLELDSVNQLMIDLENILAADGNNTFSDAMADAAFRAINRTGPGDNLNSVCNDLAPDGNNPKFNISKWILNYTNITLNSMQSYAPLLNLKSVVSNPTIVHSDCTGNKIMYIWQKSNISYEITLNESSFYLRLNQTVVHNKTLTLTYVEENQRWYNLTIKDQTGAIDFNKTIKCEQGVGLCKST